MNQRQPAVIAQGQGGVLVALLIARYERSEQSRG